jgi:hypothetical protein
VSSQTPCNDRDSAFHFSGMAASRISLKRWDRVIKQHVVPCCSMTTTTEATEWNKAKPFDQVPGAKAYPVIGTTWRFMPMFGTSLPANVPEKMLNLLSTLQG